MPRHSSAPSVDRFTTFGDLLRYLRERAHLTQRELAAQVGYHYSYISYLEKNLRLPDEASLLGRFIPALGLEEEPELAARLRELAFDQQKKLAVPTPKAGPAVGETKAQPLPVALTSLLGREREVNSLGKMLERGDIRLITIVGPPGVGKTRLALHMAEQVQRIFSDGVVFINLTPVHQEELVLPALALTLNVQEPISENLKNTLRDKHILLFIDNFEQVIDAAPELTQLLRSTLYMKILVTSRETLRVQGEHEFHLSPLPVSTDSLLDSPAVQLFMERARAVKPDFNSDEENLSGVADICLRLDGLPLAIELAAARIGTLRLSAMREQFDHRFEWLTRGGRDVPVWRQTLWGAINWSYALLSVQERALFSRLSVFTGGWTFEAAQAVCSDDTLCAPSDIFNLLMQLVDKSLVIADPAQGRYHFLETLREFALEKLKESGDLERLQQRHCEYFLKLAQTARPYLQQSNEQLQWLNRLEQEHDNLLSAFAWVTEIPARASLAMEFGHAIHAFWQIHSHIREARFWLDRILALDSTPSSIRSDLLRFASDYAGAQGDFERAQHYEEEGLRISQALGDKEAIHYSLDGLAMLAGRQGDYAKAAEVLEQVLAYRRRTNNLGRLTATINNLAIAKRRLGDLERAEALYKEAISITEQNKNYNSLAHALLGLAEVYVDRKEYIDAMQLQRRSLLIRHELGSLKGVSFSLNSLAISIYRLGQHKLATQLESASDKIRQQLGMVVSPATRAENEEFRSQLRTRLGDAEFEKVWSIGQGLSIEEAVALTMKDLDASS